MAGLMRSKRGVLGQKWVGVAGFVQRHDQLLQTFLHAGHLGFLRSKTPPLMADDEV